MLRNPAFYFGDPATMYQQTLLNQSLNLLKVAIIGMQFLFFFFIITI